VSPVTDCNSHRSTKIGDACFLRDVTESPITLVQVQLAAPEVIGYVQVRPAIPIKVIPSSREAAASRVVDSSLFGDFGKCAVPVVVQEQLPLRWIGGRV
jgi:hypothetical protein